MCGIAGFAQQQSINDKAVLERMVSALHHRGPDDSGFYCDAKIGLGMRRLSIIDVEGGHQPVFSHSRRFIAVFNGEIYNYKSLRDKLLSFGFEFQSNGDAEVIVNLYEKYGSEAFSKLRGMFAVAIWDTRDEVLVLARDPLGIKPLFYSGAGEVLLFGSEIKSILEALPEKLNVDAQALDALLAYTYIPAPFTIWKDIKKLPPAHILISDKNGVETISYWDLIDSPEKPSMTGEELREELDDSVRQHLVSDVEVGAFLSGGVDSSVVVARMQEYMDKPALAFSVRFDNSGHLFDETSFSEELREKYQFDLTVGSLSATEYERIDDAVRAFDEPFADDSIMPSDAISEMAAKKLKVILSGVGGDEFFGGYNRYQGIALQAMVDKVPQPLRRFVMAPILKSVASLVGPGTRRGDLITRFASNLFKSVDEAYLNYVTAASPSIRTRLLKPAVSQLINVEVTRNLIERHLARGKGLPPVKRAMYADVNTYLPDDVLALADRIGMRHGLEIRTPLADKELAEAAFRLKPKELVTARRKKIAFGEAVRKWLPDRIIDHKKQGFEAPTSLWLRGEEGHSMLVEETRDKNNKAFSQLIDRDAVVELIEKHRNGEGDYAKQLFTILMVSRWADIYDTRIGGVA